MSDASTRKSILYLSLHDPHVPLTGTGTRVAAFVGRLSRFFDLDLVAMAGSGQPPLPEEGGRPRPIGPVRSETIVPFRSTGYFIFSREFFREAKRLLDRNRYDFIVADYGLTAVYGLLLARRSGVPLIYSSHNIEHRAYLDKGRSDPRRLLLAPYVYGAERRAVERSAILVPITEEEAGFFARWTDRSKMIVVPQGFDDEIFHPPPNGTGPPAPIVLFCGNFRIPFNREAAAAALERVVPAVAEKRPDVRFLFVGAHPPKHAPHRNVEFPGYLDDYAGELRASAVVISPMLRGWGAPTKIVEALASGKPVVSTPVGARSIERDFKHLRVCDLDEFPAAILDGLDRRPEADPAEFEKLKERYAWDRILAPLVERMERFS
ncbi:MAG: glycosyltransferase family 4 protein [Candidatus Eisenbacteria bacterium]